MYFNKDYEQLESLKNEIERTLEIFDFTVKEEEEEFFNEHIEVLKNVYNEVNYVASQYFSKLYEQEEEFKDVPMLALIDKYDILKNDYETLKKQVKDNKATAI